MSTAVTLERGDLYFFYRPRVEEHDPQGVADIQRLMMVLSPDHSGQFRVLVIGRKRLPVRSRFWGMIDKVLDTAEDLVDELRSSVYTTKTRGLRHLPAARRAGAGLYRIIRHDDHTHLLYSLEPSRDPSDVEQDLNIDPKADYIVTVMNPRDDGVPDEEFESIQQSLFPEWELPLIHQHVFPRDLQDHFADRGYAPVDPPRYLDHPGAELVLIPVQNSSADCRSSAVGEIVPVHENGTGAVAVTRGERR